MITSISYDKQSTSMSWVTKLVHVVYKKKFGEQGALNSACNLGTKTVLTTKSANNSKPEMKRRGNQFLNTVCR